MAFQETLGLGIIAVVCAVFLYTVQHNMQDWEGKELAFAHAADMGEARVLQRDFGVQPDFNKINKTDFENYYLKEPPACEG
jgi:hypothetical protein